MADSNFNDDHFKVVAVGGGAAPAAADRIRDQIAGKAVDEPEPEAAESEITPDEALARMGISMDDLARAQEVVEAEPVEPPPYVPQSSAADRDAREAKRTAKLAEYQAARAAEVAKIRAQRSAYYAPPPEIPGQQQQGFEREM